MRALSKTTIDNQEKAGLLPDVQIEKMLLSEKLLLASPEMLIALAGCMM